MEKVKVGVVGAGIMGEIHARVCSELPNTKLISICDITPEKAKKIAKKYKLKKWYVDYTEMLRDNELEAVCVATPDHLHRDIVVSALKAGKHVLVEKPLATRVKDAGEILKIAKESKVKLMVNFTHRWVPAYAKAKELIQQGEIGDPLMAYTKKNDTIYVPTEMISWADKTSPCKFLSAHDIDLVRWYYRSEAEEVYAQSVGIVLKAKGIDVEDGIQALIRFKNGSIATFESCWIYPNTYPTTTDSFIEIIGTKGVIYLDRKSETIEVSTNKTYQYPRLSISCEVLGRLEGAFKRALEHFIDCIIKDEQPLVSGGDGKAVTEIVCAIHRSLELKRPIKLPLKEQD